MPASSLLGSADKMRCRQPDSDTNTGPPGAHDCLARTQQAAGSRSNWCRTAGHHLHSCSGTASGGDWAPPLLVVAVASLSHELMQPQPVAPAPPIPGTSLKTASTRGPSDSMRLASAALQQASWQDPASAHTGGLFHCRFGLWFSGACIACSTCMLALGCCWGSSQPGTCNGRGITVYDQQCQAWAAGMCSCQGAS